mmetsp:Transcript_97056/g.251060  ORF Transcript_97056/g.251060 Transcript_97056/m.251060 type:complete len:158 (-) Transcript_97056:11-484(-)
MYSMMKSRCLSSTSVTSKCTRIRVSSSTSFGQAGAIVDRHGPVGRNARTVADETLEAASLEPQDGRGKVHNHIRRFQPPDPCPRALLGRGVDLLVAQVVRRLIVDVLLGLFEQRALAFVRVEAAGIVREQRLRFRSWFFRRCSVHCVRRAFPRSSQL